MLVRRVSLTPAAVHAGEELLEDLRGAQPSEQQAVPPPSVEKPAEAPSTSAPEPDLDEKLEMIRNACEGAGVPPKYLEAVMQKEKDEFEASQPCYALLA